MKYQSSLSHHFNPGHSSLQFSISSTDGLLDEETIRIAYSMVRSILVNAAVAHASTTAIHRNKTYGDERVPLDMAYPQWNLSEHHALMKLWGKESAWNPAADNPNSTAFGIPQLLNLDPSTPAPLQIERGLAYIQHRYEKPSVAWSHWRSNGWY